MHEYVKHTASAFIHTSQAYKQNNPFTACYHLFLISMIAIAVRYVVGLTQRVIDFFHWHSFPFNKAHEVNNNAVPFFH